MSALTEAKRQSISQLLSAEMSKSAIARVVSVNRSTVYRTENLLEVTKEVETRYGGGRKETVWTKSAISGLKRSPHAIQRLSYQKMARN